VVHAPAKSFVARYFREHDCGLVVSDREPAALAGALDRLRRDESLRARLSANAWRRAREDFDLAKARAAFTELLGVSQADP
jgi:glycosyltransferase involved in cell wall biosynthesis